MAAGVPGSWKDTVMDSLKIGVLVLIALAALMFLLRRKPLAAKRPLQLEGPAAAPGAAAAYERQMAALPGGEELALPPGHPLTLPPPPTLPDEVDGKARIVQLINIYPDRAVEVLRLWLHEK
jgi:flagellar biosynthesis/type III secretory pathway M-ring protein FliF/YscJ